MPFPAATGALYLPPDPPEPRDAATIWVAAALLLSLFSLLVGFAALT